MQNQPMTSTINRTEPSGLDPWEPLEAHTAAAFTLAGGSFLASLFVPIGLHPFTDSAWLAGILLVGLAVVTAALGLLGLYSGRRDRDSHLSIAGAAAAISAGTSGMALLALSGLTAVAIAVPAVEFAVGMGLFAATALVMAGGYALGFLAFGIGGLRSSSMRKRSALLLVGGGALLLVPIGGALLRLGLGVNLPPGVLFPILGVVAIDTVAVGLSLRSGASSRKDVDE